MLALPLRPRSGSMTGDDRARQLLIVGHVPSKNTRRLRDAAAAAARAAIEGDNVRVVVLNPFETRPAHVLAADAVILGTTENLGYMSGALKDFFDRCYYPCLEHTQGLPYCLYIRAGNDGTGARRGVETIVSGLRWRAVQAPVICRGEWDEDFVDRVAEIGAAMAAGLEAGIF